ncbi:MAG: histidine kinase [Chitinophagaceae bacterium]|nr:histidine kinase [Chitinophagaceae bacterium]
MEAFFLKKRIGMYVISVIGFFAFFLLLINFLHGVIGTNPGFGSRGNIVPFVLLFLTLFTSSFIRMAQQWIISEKRNKNIQTEKLHTELSFLKSQINPHFLFNTLNNIYTLALTKSDFTAEAVMKLSSLMRYVVDDANSDYVPLAKEIEYLKHFVELQRIRLSDKVVIDFSVVGAYDSLSIAPLILMAFVENIFKYGISTHEDSKVIISVMINKNSLHFKSVNTIFRTDDKDVSGIGITNTVRRLDLLYPGKYSLHLDDANNKFIVDLNLTLT